MSRSSNQPHTPVAPESTTPETLNVVERNVRALVEHAAEQERARSRGERIASRISGFVGSMKFVYLHAVALALWGAVDVGLMGGADSLGMSFTRLGTAASVEAIFIWTFVLVAQNRLAAQERIRNNLDMQVSLLNEHETTHILRLVAAIGEKMGLPEARDPEIQDLIRDVAPQHMIDRIAEHSDAAQEEMRDERAGH